MKEDERRMTLTREEEILDDYPLFCWNSAFEAVQREKGRAKRENKAKNHGVEKDLHEPQIGEGKGNCSSQDSWDPHVLHHPEKFL